MTAEFLVDSIDGLTDNGNISKEFVGVILLPIVGNAAGTSFLLAIGSRVSPNLLLCLTEHVTAVTVSVKDKLTLSLGVAVGSSIVSSSLPQPQTCERNLRSS